MIRIRDEIRVSVSVSSHDGRNNCAKEGAGNGPYSKENGETFEATACRFTPNVIAVEFNLITASNRSRLFGLFNHIIV